MSETPDALWVTCVCGHKEEDHDDQFYAVDIEPVCRIIFCPCRRYRDIEEERRRGEHA